MTNKSCLLSELRQKFAEFNINGYIIPSTDEYQSEYAPKYAQRLKYITGFSGSNGIAIITTNIALLFTDGRYLIQANNQLNLLQFKVFDIRDLITFNWQNFLQDSDIIGYDPSLFNSRSISYFSELKLKPIIRNLIDIIWINQPLKPATKVYIYPLEFAGEDIKDKIKKLFIYLDQKKVDGCFITDSTSICWLLNLRANDLEFSPLMLSYVLVEHKTIHLFTNLSRIDKQVRQYLSPYVELHEEAEINSILNKVSNKIIISDNCPIIFLQEFKNCEIIQQSHDPCCLLKSCKNPVEIKAAQQSHITDSIAVCEFLAWLDEAIKNNVNLTEHDLSEKLTYFRAIQPNYIANSFSTICGFNENSAIIHYTPTLESAKLIINQGILLIDSGAHYLGCTTDVTRTISVRQATQLQMERYTQVLKGHISLATSIFPAKKTVGANLDALARRFLWQNGLDYPHSTGHGVSNCLSVHEGPQSISTNNNIVLREGMIISNEPGYYEVGSYGIRIENLMFIKHSNYPGFLEFENLTLIPYCQDLILTSLLTIEEKKYIDCYYHEIKSKVRPSLSRKAKLWLETILNI